MAMYLSFILDGELSAQQRRRLGKMVDAHVEAGRTLVTIRDLPSPKLDDMIASLAEDGVRRTSGYYDLGPMPKHAPDSKDRVVAYQLDADYVDLPANPDADYEQPVPAFKGCAFLKADRILQTSERPKGHLVKVGVHLIVDGTLGALLESFDSAIDFADVQWRKKSIPWRHIRGCTKMPVLDPDRSFNPTQAAVVCDAPITPLRLPLVAKANFTLTGERLVRNATGKMFHARELVLILSTQAAARVRSTLEVGYVLDPIYAPDSPTAQYADQVRRLLDKHIPPVTGKPTAGRAKKTTSSGRSRSK